MSSRLAMMGTAALLVIACAAPPDTIATPPGSASPTHDEGHRVEPDAATAPPASPLGEPAAALPENTPVPVRPTGGLDEVHELVGGFATVSGWVADPNGLDPDLAVEVTVDGAGTAARALVAAPTGNGPADSTGFGLDVAVEPGEHELCATVQDPETGPTPLGCRRRTFRGAVSGSPTLALTAVAPAPDRSVEVRGVITGADPATEVRLHLTAEAALAEQTIPATVDDGTFRAHLAPRAPGRHTICPRADGLDGNCGTVVIGDLAVGTAGTPTVPVTVEAPAGHAMTPAERDAGVSVQLRDGSTMWFFGDTGERDNYGNHRYFVNNTCAWANADEPERTLDAIGSGNVPPLFAAPTENFCAGHRFAKPVLWPDSAVAIPQDDGTDRVVVVMSKVCTAPGLFNFEGIGLAVAEYVYDPSDPPAYRHVEGSVIADDWAFLEQPFGRALTRGEDGFVYGYHCGPMVGEQGICEVGRVPEDRLTDINAWTFWTGGPPSQSTAWSADPSDAVPMDLPGDDERPLAGFTVRYDQDRDVYLMVYSPWPVMTDRVVVRVATSPAGPWTEALPIALPGCVDEADGTVYNCYAGTAQPSFATPTMVGIGYYDQLSVATSGLGEYFACAVPLAIDSSGPTSS